MENCISIDPSSSCTGVAIGKLEGRTLTIIEALRIKGKAKAPRRARIVQMARGIWDIISQVEPAHVVIEVPDGKIGWSQKQKGGGGGANLSIYGQAAGFMCAVPYFHPHDCEIHWIEVKRWLSGNKKSLRPDRAALLFPAYWERADAGGDIADAICLLDWWATQRRIAEVMEQPF